MKAVSMIVWDVQHGNAIYINCPNGKSIVIDLGTGDYSGNSGGLTFSPIKHLNTVHGVNQIDCLIITHPHKDHIDDIISLEKVSTILFSRPSELSNDMVKEGVRIADKPLFDKYCQMNDKYIADPTGTESDIRIPENYGGLIIKLYSTPNCSSNNFNNHSIIAILKYADVKVIIPGDNENESIDELMKLENFKADVENAFILIAPHHGRESGYHSEFVKLVNPSLTIVSDGSICDTSSNGRYTANSSGWYVKKHGQLFFRRCLTTNSDGEIVINFGFNDYDTTFKEVLIF